MIYLENDQDVQAEQDESGVRYAGIGVYRRQIVSYRKRKTGLRIRAQLDEHYAVRQSPINKIYFEAPFEIEIRFLLALRLRKSVASTL